MDLKALLAAAPFLRRLWIWLPGPFKVIVVVLAAILAIYRIITGDDEDQGPEELGAGEDPEIGPG